MSHFAFTPTLVPLGLHRSCFLHNAADRSSFSCNTGFRAGVALSSFSSPRVRMTAGGGGGPALSEEGASALGAKPRVKRLIVLADGTWQEPDQKIGTNVLRLAAALGLEGDAEEDAAGRQRVVQQVVHYTPGLGTNGPIDRILGGGVGIGIDRAITELYFFLASNYDVGDEIYMFGFSRGAYTVRSLAGMIRTVGLVRRRHINKVSDAYGLYRKGGDKDRGTTFRRDYCTRGSESHPIITCIGVWDSVGSLGVPFDLIGPLNRTEFSAENYKFINTQISKYCRHGIHLMSIDEDRKTFSPTLMTPADEEKWRATHGISDDKGNVAKQVTEVYLPGTHGGVGGGSKDSQMTSQYALWYMYHELKRRCPHLKIDYDLLGISHVGEDGGRLKSEKIPEKGSEILTLMKKYVPPVPPTIIGRITRLLGKEPRKFLFEDVDHKSVKVRYDSVPQWRPKALDPFRNDISQLENPLH